MQGPSELARTWNGGRVKYPMKIGALMEGISESAILLNTRVWFALLIGRPEDGNEPGYWLCGIRKKGANRMAAAFALRRRDKMQFAEEPDESIGAPRYVAESTGGIGSPSPSPPQCWQAER